STLRPPPSSTLFPYTTLFRSCANNLMGLRCCSSYPARKLFHVELTIVNTVQREDLTKAAPDFRKLEGERRRRFVAQLNAAPREIDRKSTRLNSSHVSISYAVF